MLRPVSAELAEVDFYEGNLNVAIARMQAALEVLSAEEPDADTAEVSAQLGRLLFFVGRPDEALPHLERALEVAEHLWLPETLAQALNTKSLVLLALRRPVESDALIEKALSVALAADRHGAVLRAYFNLAERQSDVLRIDESLETYRVGLAYAMRVGDKFYNLSMQAGTVSALLTLGDWDEALAIAQTVIADEHLKNLELIAAELVPAAGALVRRGDVEGAKNFLDRLPSAAVSENVQNRSAQHAVLAAIARVEGHPGEALELARHAVEAQATLGLIARGPTEGIIESLEAAFALGDEDTIDELLDLASRRPPGEGTPMIDGHRLRFTARRSSSRGDDEKAATTYAAAMTMFEETRNVFWQATVRLEAAEHHAAHGRPDEASRLIAAARPTFEQIGARPSLDRADRVEALTKSSTPIG